VLSASYFAVLNTIRVTPGLSQRDYASATGLSLGTVNAALRHLTASGLIDGGGITTAGLAALAPHKVGNAIIMAAGLSKRFAPLSYERPKGLLEVRGERLIEREIRQLHEAGIEDITVVVGYKMEQFLYLEDRFGVTIVVNPVYDRRNNNSTLKLVEDRLANTYVCSSDNYFTQNVFEPYVYRAYYAAVFHAGETDEWGLATGAHDRITRVTPGTADAWVMLGHTYWDTAFSQRFRAILDAEYDLPETAGKLWEDIYREHVDELDMRIRRYEPGVLWEFDTLADLRAFDEDFIVNIDSSILDNICTTLRCQRSDLAAFTPIEGGMTNSSFRFDVQRDASYVYRHPGVATQGIIDRAAEATAEEIAQRLDIDTTFIHLDPATGWKVSHYVAVSDRFDYHDPTHVARAMALIRRLHTSGETIDATFALMEEAVKVKRRLSTASPTAAQNPLNFPDFDVLDARAAELARLVATDGVAPVLCHNAFYDANLLVDGERIHLIDWEYAGMGDYASDLGVFVCCCSDYTYDDALQVFAAYFGRTPSAAELRHCVAYVSIAAYYWFLWALMKDAYGESVGEYTYLWYRYAKDYGERALALFGER